MTSIKLLTDQAIYETYEKGAEDSREDSLSFSSYADVITGVVEGTDGPFTIGVFGEWGTGKTSLLKMVESHYKTKADNNATQVIPIWFNAWKFENTEHPIVPLIATIVAGLEKEKSKLEKLKDKGKSLIRSLRAIAYGFSSKSKISVPGFAEIEAGFVAKDMIDRDEKLTYDPLLERSLYHQAFDTLDKISLKNEEPNVKILIIIDDLDRCFPKQAVKLLESIKLVLAQPGFLFLIGVSKDVIEKYLIKKYKEEYGVAEFQGRTYLDKIIQLSFDIPSHSSRMEPFVESLINELEKDDDRDQLKQISNIIGIACKNTPRTVVRFINRLVIDKAIYALLPHPKSEKVEEIEIGYFAVTRSLQQQWPTLYELLISQDDSKDDKDAIGKEISEWKEEKIKELATITTETNETTDLVQKVLQKLARAIYEDTNLKKLLLSDIGKKWLTKADKRKATSEFIIAQPDVLQQDEPVQQDYDTQILPYGKFAGSFLQGASFRQTQLAGANFARANLVRAALTNASLTYANLTGADLTGADLTGADLTGANLTDANLTDANLTDANLTDANLTDANLTDANLIGADLTHTDLRYLPNFHFAKNYRYIICDKTTICAPEQVEGTILEKKVTIKERGD